MFADKDGTTVNSQDKKNILNKKNAKVYCSVTFKVL